MKKKAGTTAIILITCIMFAACVAVFICGCSSDDSGGSVFVSPTPIPSITGTPKLLFVSTRNGQEDVGVFVGDIDFNNGTLANIRKVTTQQWSGLYNDPFMNFAQNKVVCTMTQGSLIWNDIRVVDFNTGELATLTDSTERNNTRPVVDINGKIVYSSYVRDSRTQEIRRMDMDGSNNTLLTTLELIIDSMGIDNCLCRAVLALVDQNQKNDIYIYSFDSCLTRVTNTPNVNEFSVNYNPGGKILYMADGIVASQFDIYEINIDGTNNRRITNGEMAYNGPLWQYDQWIVFQSGEDVWLHDTSTAQNTNLTGSQGSNYSHSLFYTQ